MMGGGEFGVLYSVRSVVLRKRSRKGSMKLFRLTMKVTSMERIRNEFIGRTKLIPSIKFA